MSVHASWAKLSHSSLTKSSYSMRGAGFEHDDVDALLGELVAERAAAGARSDDDDDAVVAQIKFAAMVSSRCASVAGTIPAQSQSMSLKPRSM